jgi:catechol 2,3-dioxygenase-like lactoylglutathione lyase family enzyme
MAEKGGLFRGGPNIAIKTPPGDYIKTVMFYRDTLGLEVLSEDDNSVSFAFGANRLWIDRVEALSQAEVWLEIVANNVKEAEDRMARGGVRRCDEIERLPLDFDGFWIANPAGIVHLVASPEESAAAVDQ